MSIMNINTLYEFLILVGLVTLVILAVIYIYVRSENKRRKRSLEMIAIRKMGEQKIKSKSFY